MLAALSDSHLEQSEEEAIVSRDPELKKLQDSLEDLGDQLNQAVQSVQNDVSLDGFELDKLRSFTDQLPHLVDQYRTEEKPPSTLKGGDQSLVGRELASCMILDKIGSGGMGTVYLGRHLVLGKKVALKVLPSWRSSNPRAVSRFKREMRAIGAIESPYVVNALGAGVDQGVHYLVMEYIRGVDVGYLQKSQGQIGLAECCEIIRQAALGLAAIHEAGLVHRDFKPSNLMVDATGRVKVLDLGLVHLVQQDEDELTKTGAMMGTLDYMAPEQSQDSRSVDYRTDLFSLGATFFKLLTGETPLTVVGQGNSFSRVRAFIESSIPSIRVFCPDLDIEIINLLDTLLQKSPELRTISAREVAEQLKPYCRNSCLSEVVEHSFDLKRQELTSENRATASGVSLTTFQISNLSNLISHHRMLFLFMGLFLGLLASFLFYPRLDSDSVANFSSTPLQNKSVPKKKPTHEELFPKGAVPGLSFLMPPPPGNIFDIHGIYQGKERSLLVCESVVREARIRLPGFIDLQVGEFESVSEKGVITGYSRDLKHVVLSQFSHDSYVDMETQRVVRTPFEWSQFEAVATNADQSRVLGVIRKKNNIQSSEAIALWTPDRKVQRLDPPGIDFKSLEIVDTDEDCRFVLVRLFPHLNESMTSQYFLYQCSDDAKPPVTNNTAEMEGLADVIPTGLSSDGKWIYGLSTEGVPVLVSPVNQQRIEVGADSEKTQQEVVGVSDDLRVLCGNYASNQAWISIDGQKTTNLREALKSLGYDMRDSPLSNCEGITPNGRYLYGLFYQPKMIAHGAWVLDLQEADLLTQLSQR